jgi:NAD(P)-dependent dehydrogenase (short-subunit alcohol dehydrogenase family)
MSNRFEEKSIIITGGGAGLGRECALQWSAEGGRILVTDVVEDRAHAVAQEITDAGGIAAALKVDVINEAEVAESVRVAVERFGRLDIMFANAGRSLPGGPPLRETTEEQWDEVVNIVFRGVFFSGKHAALQMMKQRSGNIVVTTSAAGINAYPVGFGAYAAGKAGAIGLVRSMATEFGQFGIRVNGLAPTHGMSINFALPLDAPVLNMSYEEFALQQSGQQWSESMCPGPLKVNRPPSLKDNAAVATFLASDDSAFMSGLIIPACDDGNFARTSIFFEDTWTLESMAEGAEG